MLSTGRKWAVQDTGLPVVKGFFFFCPAILSRKKTLELDRCQSDNLVQITKISASEIRIFYCIILNF